MHIIICFDLCSWLMSVYARNILIRLPQLLATCTAIFGNVLKIDSTKKVCKKLQGIAAGSASCCTNVGNEKGEVLISGVGKAGGSSIHGHRINSEVCLKTCCKPYNPLFYSDTRRRGRILHSYCTQTVLLAEAGIVEGSTAAAVEGWASCRRR